MKFCVFSSDPLYKYHQKGEIKARYWNPEELFDEVCVFTFCDQDIAPEKVQALVGRARLCIVPLGYPSPLRLWGQRRRALPRPGRSAEREAGCAGPGRSGAAHRAGSR